MNRSNCKTNDSEPFADAFFRHYFPDWDTQPLLRIRQVLAFIALSVLVLGTVANTATLPTLWRYRGLRFSTKLFFCGIAIGDFIGMPLNMTIVWYILQYAHNFLNDVVILCRTYLFVTQTFLGLSLFSFAAVATERLLMVIVPNKMRSANVKRYTAVVMACLAGLALLSSIFNLSYDIGDNCLCSFTGPVELLIFNYYMMNSLIIFVICQVLVTGIALYRIIKKRQVVINNEDSINDTNCPKNASLTPFKMAMAAGIFQSACLLPYVLLLVRYLVLPPGQFLISEGADLLLYIAATLSLSINFAGNFFVYILVSRGFRRSFLFLLTSRRSDS